MKNWYWVFAVVVIGSLSIGNQTLAQGKKHIIQLSGIVLGEDSISTLPGVHVYVPKAARGTTTNYLGYFSMPVLEGDSVVFSSVGYQRQYFVVPKTPQDHLTLVIDLKTDTTYLDEVAVMPFPTEEVLKEAVLALNIPVDGSYSNDNLDAELLQLMVRTQPLDGYSNYRILMETNQQHYQNRFGPPVNPFLNPFNWAKFLRNLKNRKKNN